MLLRKLVEDTSPSTKTPDTQSAEVARKRTEGERIDVR